MGERDRITIAEVRARRTDPAWRRRYQLADLRALALVVVLVLLPVGGLLWPPVGLGLSAALLLAGPPVLWWGGPTVGLDRRSATLVAVPVVNLVVLTAALWRSAHLGIQRWQGPLQPQWDDGAWTAAMAVGAVCWLGTGGLVVLALL